MNVLVIGSGGREHAIVWRLKQSPKVKKIYCAPGNGGIGDIAETIPLKADDLQGLVQFAETHHIDLTVVGSESPLVNGIVDLFEAHGLTIFGPSKAAAQIEGSKIFLKDFLKRHSIPTAQYASFHQSEHDKAVDYVRSTQPPYVIKTDGLAAGKGVAICQSVVEAEKTLDEYFKKNVFGDAGASIVIEEFMSGEEASLFALCDGERYVLLSSAQDHKRIGEGDTGKNTGGMGAYAPAPVVTAAVLERVEKEILEPTLKGMLKDGHPYKGCLYIGLMINDGTPKVVEYNCRLGDPETQVVMPLIESDPFDLFYACAQGTLNKYTLKVKNETAVCVVIASNGYPDEYKTGKEISGLEKTEADAIVFHAGTKKVETKFLTSGGRVLGVTATGESLKMTMDKTYAAVKKISFDGAYFRSDIGKKGLK